MAMVEGRRAVLVQDEFDIKTPCELAWGMTTDAEIEIEKGAVAVLKLKGKELVVRLQCSHRARFAVESAEQEAPQRTNKGVHRLVVKLPQASGDVRIAVLLSPVWPDGQMVETVEIKPLADW
jgi:hypothetical protein